MLQTKKSHWPRQKQASNVKKAALKSCKMHVKNMSKNGHFGVICGSKTACFAPVGWELGGGVARRTRRMRRSSLV